jgi:predicted solute-binding protein
VLVPLGPELPSMLARCDAALVIGDNALCGRRWGAPEARIYVGGAGTEMTGLPFVWAFWAGRAGAVSTADGALQERGAGRAAAERLPAASRCARPSGDRRQLFARQYQHHLSEDEQAAECSTAMRWRPGSCRPRH